MVELKAILLTQGMHGMVSQVEGLAKALVSPSTWLTIPCIPCVKRIAFNSSISSYI